MIGAAARDNRLTLEGVDVPADYLNDTILTLTGHESIRRFESTKIPDAMLELILSAARSAPTSSNLQAYSIIVVDDDALRARLAAIAGQQKFIEQAPVFLVFCADVARLRRVSARQGRPFGADTLEMFLLASVDAALAMQNSLVAAESLGLAVTPIGAVRDHPDQIAAEVGLPDGVFAVAGMCVGFEKPGARRGTKPRLPQHVTVHRNQYSTETLEEGIVEYDKTMIDRKTYAGRHVTVPGEPGMADEEYGWAEHTALRVSDPTVIGGPPGLGRRDLRTQLELRGFSFD